MPETRFIPAAELLPAAWTSFLGAGPVRVFNPGLLDEDEGWILAYRVVGPDGQRRIGLCRLDAEFCVRAASPIPWSDEVRFSAGAAYPARATSWLADPRLYRLGGRLFLHWNSGWHEPENYQFLQELDSASLRPVGEARELRMRSPRRPLEKNWSFFGEGPFYALYSLTPQRLLRFSLEGRGPIEFHDFAVREWDHTAYTNAYGELRGGTPPQRVGPDYFGIGHSVFGTPENYRYVAAAYRFEATAPFRLTAGPAGPLALGPAVGGERSHPPLNPAIAEVIYPCGAVYGGGRWVISYGVNDERCALAILPHGEILAALRPVSPSAAAGR